MTVTPLVLCGTGVEPNIRVSPHFEVFRLETKINKLAELQLKVENLSECMAHVKFDKIFEIEALLEDIEKSKLEKIERVKSEPINNKKAKGKKEKTPKAQETREKADKKPKYSDSLTDKELDAIEKHFKKTTGESRFALKSTEKYVTLQPNSHSSLTIFCGDPEQIRKKFEAPKKGKQEKHKGKEQEEEKKADSQRKKEEKTGRKEDALKSDDGTKSVAKITPICEDKQFITQYNVKVGKVHVKSIILICTIKC